MIGDRCTRCRSVPPPEPRCPACPELVPEVPPAIDESPVHPRVPTIQQRSQAEQMEYDVAAQKSLIQDLEVALIFYDPEHPALKRLAEARARRAA